MQSLRYLAYVAFAVTAFVFWATFYMLVLGVFPFPVEPACSLALDGCPQPSLWWHLFNQVVILGTIPATAFVFIFSDAGFITDSGSTRIGNVHWRA